MEVRSTLEIKIQKFVINYGAETLILWLDHFDKIISTKDYPLFHTLEKEACKACDITLADMHMFSKPPCTDAKRIISFIALHHLKLGIPSIATLLGISDRTVNYYVKDAEDWINLPQSNRIFMESYNKVITNFKIE